MYTESNNKFISSLYTLVEAMYYKDYSGMKPKQITEYTNKCINECKSIVNRIRNLSEPLSFDDIWQFTEFVYMAEKVYFYQNVQSSGICCDKCTPLDRILFFDFSSNNLYIKLMMHKTNVADVLDISVYRDWGKKINTQFHVENQNCTISSDSDHMLLNTINAYIQNSVANLFDSYIELASSKAIYDCVLGNMEDKKREEVR